MQILAPLAFWLHRERPRGVATEGEVKDKLTQFLAKRRGVAEDHPDLPQAVEDFLRRVREHTGLLVERAPRLYGFMHLTFEEYFDDSAAVRWSVASALGQIGSERAIESLLKALKADDSAKVRLRSADALGSIGGERAIEALLEALKPDNSEAVRGSAAEALGQIGSQRAIGALLEALKTDDSAAVRGKAASALGSIGGERAIEALLEALKTDNDSGLVAHAAWGLGNLAGNRKIKTNQAVFKDAAERLRRLLDRPGFDESVSIIDNYYSHRYDVIWEALWNVCQKQGIV